ncbi:DUF2589 domain-containing protein [Flavobacterium sp.]|uniref:DUF2589 domain-containing protein n=1 Tax=Flavobacterium sp. TaxID=239 RepID=UPI0026047819|nr:DUF2589 domain-containing protein [Flavobacterium sp.]
MANPGTELASLDFGNLIGGPLNAVITAQSNAAISTANFIKSVGFDENNEPVYVDFKYPKEVITYVPSSNPYLLSAKVKADVTGFQPNEVVNIVFKTTPPSDTIIEATGTLTADSTGKILANSYVAIQNQGEYKAKSDGTIATAISSSTIGASVSTAIDLDEKTSTFIPAKPAVFQEMQFSVPILTMLPVPFIKVDEITIDFNAKINSVETQSQSSELDVKGSVEAGYGGKRGYVKFNGSVAYKKTTSSGSSVERTYSMAIHVKASQDEMPAGIEKLLNILEGAMISTPGKLTLGK